MPNTMYTVMSAATSSKGRVASDAWKTWAVPWKLPMTLSGIRISRATFSMISVAWPSATPGARLNDSVTAGNWPW